MDLLKVIDSAIADLPDGDYSPGLSAVRRHVAAAIRHFERADSRDIEPCTDAIYRCNQAFEGGLKEAYRVFASKDPSKLSPFEIEKYIEQNSLLRPRVLKQLTRYREDYRNPSAHDYKLDFDEDEAILAIVAVCAFTRLLTKQIGGKVAYDAGSAIVMPSLSLQDDIKSNADLAKYLAAHLPTIISQFPTDDLDDDKIQFFVSGSLNRMGFDTDLRIFENNEQFFEDPPWNNVIGFGDHKVPLEFRILPDSSLDITLQWLQSKMVERDVTDLVLVCLSGDMPERLMFNELMLSNSSRIYFLYVANLPLKGESEARAFRRLLGS